MERVSVTEADLLEAIREAFRVEDPEGARTAKEIADSMGATGAYGLRMLRERLAGMIRDDMVEVVKVRRTGLDGRNALVPAYRLRGEAKAA